MKLFLLILYLIILPFTSFTQDNNHDAAQLLSQYIQKKSLTGNENEAGHFIIEECKNAGLHVSVFHDNPGQINFAGSLYPLSLNKPNIILLSHIDVVLPGDTAKWKYPPFSGQIAEGAVWGRGAIDIKGLCIMQFSALSQFAEIAREKDLPYNVSILCVSSEEIGGVLGSKSVVDEFLKELNPIVVFGEGGSGADGVIDSDPNQRLFGISVAEKSAMWLKLNSVQNKMINHASVSTSQNNIDTMLKVLGKLSRKKTKVYISPPANKMIKTFAEYEKGLKKCVYKNIRIFKPLIKKKLLKHPIIGPMVSEQLTLTQIYTDNGSANSHASIITAEFDGRFIREKTAARKYKKVVKLAEKNGLIISGLFISAPPLTTTPEIFYSYFNEALQINAPGSIVLPIQFPAFCDNNYFREAGVPAYGIFPANLTIELIGSIHNINERLPIKLLNDGVDVYKTFISLAQGID